MLTSAECQAKADEKSAQADLEPRHRRRLLTAADGSDHLAGIMGQLEASTVLPDEEATRVDAPQLGRNSVIGTGAASQAPTLSHAPIAQVESTGMEIASDVEKGLASKSETLRMALVECIQKCPWLVTAMAEQLGAGSQAPPARNACDEALMLLNLLPLSAA